MEMLSSSSFSVSGPPTSVQILSSPPLTNPILSFSSTSRRLQSKQLQSTILWGTNRQPFRICANANVSGGKGTKNDVIMVDPLEAKRLATQQMQEIQAREKLKRQRWIEAINGTWAMIGLTAGLVVEGKTGHGILSQLGGYWEVITSFFSR